MGFRFARGEQLDVISLKPRDSARKKDGMGLCIIRNEVSHPGVICIAEVVRNISADVAVRPGLAAILPVVLLQSC